LLPVRISIITHTENVLGPYSGQYTESHKSEVF
jgi:hypothetical protein